MSNLNKTKTPHANWIQVTSKIMFGWCLMGSTSESEFSWLNKGSDNVLNKICTSNLTSIKIFNPWVAQQMTYYLSDFTWMINCYHQKPCPTYQLALLHALLPLFCPMLLIFAVLLLLLLAAKCLCLFEISTKIMLQCNKNMFRIYPNSLELHTISFSEKKTCKIEHFGTTTKFLLRSNAMLESEVNC